MSNDDIQAELRKVNETLGFIRGTLEGVDDRLDNIEGLYGRVQTLEVKASRNMGYAAGVAACVAIVITILGFIW